MSQSARVVAVLSDGLWHSIQDIHLQVGTMRLNSRVAELRSRGYTIACRKTGGRYAYRLVAKPGVLKGRDGSESHTQAVSASASRSLSASGSTSGDAGAAAAPGSEAVTSEPPAPPEQTKTLGARGKPGRSSVTQSARSRGGMAETSRPPQPPQAPPEALFDMPKKNPWA